MAAAIAALFFLPGYRMAAGCVIVVHVLLLICGVIAIRAQFFGRVFIKAGKDTRLIALTFDDGPDPLMTPDIVALLGRYDLKATFFIIAAKALRCPDVVRQCFDQGHTIACHDLRHSNTSNFRRTKQLLKDISESRKIIHAIIGKEPLLYRPPMGLMNSHVLRALKKLGMYCVGWSRKANESGNRKINAIKKIHALAGPGAVVLLHDVLPMPEYKEEILRQMEALFKSIHENKLNAIAVDELFKVIAYKE